MVIAPSRTFTLATRGLYAPEKVGRARMANEDMQRQWNSPRTMKIWRVNEAAVGGLTAPLLDRLQPAPGERMMDVGCGGGLSTIEVAKAVGPAGHVVGADISEELLALSRERAAAAEVTNVSFMNADVQVADVPGAPFDAVLSRLGVMFFGDPVAAFANMRRHMKPRARLVFICFQDFKANDWYPSEILAKYEPSRPPSRFLAPTPFALGDQAATEGFLLEAGFRGIDFEAISLDFDVPYETASVVGRIPQFNLAPDVASDAITALQAHETKYVTKGRHLTERKFWIVRAANPA